MKDEENNKNIEMDDSSEPSFDLAQDDSSESDLTFVESTEDGDVLPMKDVTRKLREDLRKSQKEKEEYLTGWQRAKADYINLQKELEHVRLNSSILAKEKMMHNLLPVLDSFDMAFANKEHWEKIDKDWQSGITSIYQQFISGLSKSGIKKINQADIPFDPNIHQSISLVETNDESKDHTVASILQCGYEIGESKNQTRIIRPAKVSIYEYRKS